MNFLLFQIHGEDVEEGVLHHRDRHRHLQVRFTFVYFVRLSKLIFKFMFFFFALADTIHYLIYQSGVKG